MSSTNIKIVVWHVLVVLFALLMWGSGSSGTHFNEVTGLDVEPVSFFAFLFLTSLIALGYTIFRAKSRLWPLTISLIVGVLFMAQFGFSLLNLLGVAIFTGLNYEASSRVGKEASYRLKIDSHTILRRGLAPIIIGIFILISFAGYRSSLAEDIKSKGRLPNQVQEFIRQVVEKTVGNKLDGATPKEKQSIMSEVSRQVFQDANNFLKPYFRYAPPALAFGLFLILLGLSWLFISISMLVGALLFWVLKKTNVVEIKTKQVEAEILVV